MTKPEIKKLNDIDLYNHIKLMKSLSITGLHIYDKDSDLEDILYDEDALIYMNHDLFVQEFNKRGLRVEDFEEIYS